MSGNLGMPAADQGTWQFSFNYDYNNLQNLKSGSQSLNDHSRKRLTRSWLMEMGYALTDKLAMDALFTFVIQERVIKSPFGQTETKTTGLGDATILLKYRLISNLQVGYAMKAPLGKTDHTNEQGIPLTADFQPGSGAWDQIGYLNYSNQFNFRPTMSYSFTGIFRFTGRNKDYFDGKYEFGDETQLIAGLSDRLLIGEFFMDPGLRIRYRSAARDRFNDNPFPGSGGVFVFIAPSVAFMINQNFGLNVSFETPLYSKVNETQLVPSYRMNVGLAYTIPPKLKL